MDKVATLLRAIADLIDCEKPDDGKPWTGQITSVRADPDSFYTIPFKPEDPPMPDNQADVTIPAEYYAGRQKGLHFFFGTREVFPSAARALFTVAGANPDIIERTEFKPSQTGSEAWLYLRSGAVEGQTARVSISTDETGPNDDFVWNVTVGPFAVTSSIVDAGAFEGVAFISPDPVPDPDPVPVPDPAPDPAPVDPTEPTSLSRRHPRA